MSRSWGLKKNRQGQALIEVLVAMAVLAIVIVAVSASLAFVILSPSRNLVRLQQAALLEAGFDSAQALARGKWTDLYKPMGTINKGDCGTCARYGVAKNVAGNAWELTGGTAGYEQSLVPESGGRTYKRWITIENVSRTGTNGAGSIDKSQSEIGYDPAKEDPTTQKVKITVRVDGFADVTQTRYFTRSSGSSDDIVCVQTNWSGAANTEPFKCGAVSPTNFSTQTNIDSATAGEIKLSAGATSGTLDSYVLETDTTTEASFLTITWDGSQ